MDLTVRGLPATVEDFFVAERTAKSKLDEWLWPQIRKGEVPPTIDQYYWGEYLRALMDRIHAPEEDRDTLMLRVATGFRDIKLWSRVLPETPAYLGSLRGRGYFLGVISNSIGTIEEQLGRVDLLQYFHTVLDSAIVGMEKPHPEIFRLATERASVAPSEAIFIGDTHSTDVGGAQLAGIHGVLIDRVGAYPNIQSPRITSLPELDKILEEFSCTGV